MALKKIGISSYSYPKACRAGMTPEKLIQKEIEEGKSWLRVRNQEPCNACIYQWLCPSPSDYEIMIGQTNLCHVNIHNPNCENL